MPVKNEPRHIKLLPPELRDQIAAGEVVERPASVLKELLENSLDAGADEIAVTVEDGGQSYLAVQDNGHGIAADELELAVTSHATSKIHSFAELLRVASYGFRGEALPSIGSVARLRVRSLREGLENGTEGRFVEIEHGKIIGRGAAALNKGTMVEVRDLFSNVPARLKFLKNNTTELKRCQEVVLRLALANTQAAFLLQAGKREIYNFAKGESLAQRLARIWPPQVCAELAPFALERNGISVRGLASHPRSAQPRGDRMFFYVNGRSVNDRLLQRAAREAYKGRLLAREYPQIVLFLNMDPEEVDVNVHPAKSEVRFRDERSVFGAVLRAVEGALSSLAFSPDEDTAPRAAGAEQGSIVFAPLYSGQPEGTVGGADTQADPNVNSRVSYSGVADALTLASQRPQGFWGSLDNPSIISARPYEAPPSMEDLLLDDANASWSALREPAADFGTADANSAAKYAGSAGGEAHSPEPAHSAGNTPYIATGQSKIFAATAVLPGGFTYMGQVADTYLVLMRDSQLLLLDQHAVHERILVNRIKAEAGSGQSQLLALPVEMRLHPAEYEHLQQIWGDLSGLGFSLALPSSSLLQIKGIPPLLGLGEAREFLRDAMADKGSGINALLNMMACKGAIKAGQRLSLDEALGLIHKWLQTPEREFCPHGRPAVLVLGERELEKMFKRSS